MLDLSKFTKIDSYEDCPVDEEMLVWDGCDFHIDYVSYDSDTGNCYPANVSEFIAYLQLPSQEEAQIHLGTEGPTSL